MNIRVRCFSFCRDLFLPNSLSPSVVKANTVRYVSIFKASSAKCSSNGKCCTITEKDSINILSTVHGKALRHC